MTKFQDPRAATIAEQIDAINLAGYSSSYDPFQHQMVYGGLSPVEGVLGCDMFITKVRETAQKREALLTLQVEQQISGIEWYTVEYGSITVELPRLHEDLTLVAGDKEILMQSKPVALEFLAHWNQVFKLWRYERDNADCWQSIQWIDFYQEFLHQQWVEIWVDDYISPFLLSDGIVLDKPNFAINACCYWGNPLEVHNRAAYPQSGSMWFQWNNFTPWK